MLGEYSLHFLDSDDQYVENYLELFFDKISKETGPHLCFSSAEIVGNSNPYLALTHPVIIQHFPIKKNFLITPMAWHLQGDYSWQSCFEFAQFPLHFNDVDNDRHLCHSFRHLQQHSKAAVYQYDLG